MKTIMNNKTYASMITITDGKIKRQDRTGSVVENIYRMLTQAVEEAVQGEVIYVTRFLYETLKRKDYEFWLGGRFKSGELLTDGEMDAVIAFNSCLNAGVVFRNIDRYTLNDVPSLDYELGLMVTEVVSTRTDWNGHKVITDGGKSISVPEATPVVSSEKTASAMKGLTISLNEEKKEVNDMNTERKEDMVNIYIEGLESLQVDTELEKKMKDVQISVKEEKKVLVKTPAPMKTPKDKTKVVIEVPSGPTHFIDPFEDVRVEVGPPASTPSGSGSSSASADSVRVEIVSAVRESAPKSGFSPVSNRLSEMILERRTARSKDTKK